MFPKKSSTVWPSEIYKVVSEAEKRGEPNGLAYAYVQDTTGVIYRTGPLDEFKAEEFNRT